MKIRVILALLACKTSRRAARLLHRGGTSAPGRLALKLCPDLLRTLSSGVKTVVVTGTNGKTTTAAMLRRIFDDASLSYLSNRSGANLMAGVVTEFAAESTIFGRCKKEYAIIECDEAALKNVTKYLKPRVLAVTNLFRDQLDRYGEVTNTLNGVAEGISHTPETTLCLNADCSLTASLASGCPNRAVFFGINSANPDYTPAAVSDAPRCLRCGAEYGYEYHTLAHLGGFYCGSCGYKRPAARVAVESVSPEPDGSAVAFSVDGESFPAYVGLPAYYNVYNAAAAVACAWLLGLDARRAAGSLSEVRCGFGRMESFSAGGKTVRMILVKNPAGCNQAAEYVAGARGDFALVMCLNDGYQDGTDVSWIWDCELERLMSSPGLKLVAVSGTRAEDMRLRLKYAGMDEERIRVIRDGGELVRLIAETPLPTYVLPNYTAMLDLRGRLRKKFGGREFWE